MQPRLGIEDTNMARRALLVGIDTYHHLPQLQGAAADAYAMRDLICRHDNGEPNYHARVVTNPSNQMITHERMVGLLEHLFDAPGDEVLFFFAGHGMTSAVGGYICTSEANHALPGLAMNEIVVRANKSKAREVLIILDCCYSGIIGDSPYDKKLDQLHEGRTLLAASRPSQRATEKLGHGVFTRLLVDGLHGGAADILGNVTAADLYAYADQALDAWEQRPVYKSYTTAFSTVRKCTPMVSYQTLRAMLDLFDDEDCHLRLDETFEEMHAMASPENVANFYRLKELRNGGLLYPVDHPDLYWAAVRGGRVALTMRGKRYWRVAKKQLI